jgi:hypothetical protein
MASNPLATQFKAHLDDFQISLEPSALNYLTSMLAVMSMSDKAKDIREATEMFLEEAEVDPEKINQFYVTLGKGNVKMSSGFAFSFHFWSESDASMKDFDVSISVWPFDG